MTNNDFRDDPSEGELRTAIDAFKALNASVRRIYDPVLGRYINLFNMHNVPINSDAKLTDELPHVPFQYGLGDFRYQHSFSGMQLQGIEKFSTLSHLNLSETYLTDAEISHLARLPNLTWLDISWTRVSTKGLRILSQLQNLSSLFICFMTNIGHEGLAEEISSFKALSCLDICGHDPTEGVMCALSRCPRLAFLTMSSGTITDNAAAHWSGLSHLRSLELQGPELTEQQSDILSQLEIAEIRMHANEMSDDGLRRMAKLPNLSWLDGTLRNITDEGLKFLSPLNRLKFLALGGTAVTDSGMKALEPIQSLKSLLLMRTAISDEGLRDISKLKNLSLLNLARTRITDAGLKVLGSLPQLSILNVKGTEVTMVGVTELQKALPNCHIEWSENQVFPAIQSIK